MVLASLRNLLVRYDRALNANPLRVKCITSACINFSADTIGQLATSDHWDPKRSLIYGIVYGGAWYAPFMHIVTTTWGRILPSTAISSLAFKSAVDVSTSFAINLCGVISLQAWYRGDDPIASVKRNLWDAWTLGCCFHPIANMVVYSCPVIYRVLCLNTFSFMWNSFLIRRQTMRSRELKTNENE